jgi:hypothetical protein
MTTDEMLIEIISYQYNTYGSQYVFLDYSYMFKTWSITWRNPVEFSNDDKLLSATPREACEKALQFINERPNIFKK